MSLLCLPLLARKDRYNHVCEISNTACTVHDYKHSRREHFNIVALRGRSVHCRVARLIRSRQEQVCDHAAMGARLKATSP